eukprot:4253258-Amphidinium_carterae.1
MPKVRLRLRRHCPLPSGGRVLDVQTRKLITNVMADCLARNSDGLGPHHPMRKYLGYFFQEDAVL